MDVVNAIQNQNVQVAAGQVGQPPTPAGQQLQLPLSTLGRLDTEKQFGDIILKTGTQSGPTNAVVYTRDVGRIELGSQQYDQTSTLDGQPSAGLAIFLLPGANALDVADAVKKKMQQLQSRFPPGLEYQIIYDTTPFIRQSVAEVIRTLVEAVLLVALVVLFFLQDWKAMILPMIDVSVSLVGTFAILAVLGFSLNNLTLFGLVLAIGIVVDDALDGAGEHRAPDRDRPGCPSRYAQGHGGVDRTDRGHHAGAQLGVPAQRVHPRPDGSVLPPVRGDHRGRDDHLGHQRLDA